MSEISCRVFVVFERAAPRSGVELQEFVEGDPGRSLPQQALMGPLRAIASGLASPAALYRFGVRWGGPALYRCFEFALEEDPRGLFRFEMRIPEDRPGSLAAHAASWGALGPSPAAETAEADLGAARHEISEVHEAVARSERELRAALDHLLDRVLVYTLSGDLMWVDQTWERRYGTPEPLGRLEDHVVERDREPLVAHLAGGGSDRVRVRVRVGDDLRHVECGSPVPVVFRGQPAQLVVCRDVTERIRVEEALRRSQETSRALLGALPDHVVRVEADGTIGAVGGPSRFAMPMLGPEHVGRAREELLSQRPFLGREAIRRAAEATRRAHETFEVQRVEYRAEGVEPRLDRAGEALDASEIDRAVLRRAVAEARDGAERVRRIIGDLSALAKGEEEPLVPVDIVQLLRGAARLSARDLQGTRLTWEIEPVPPVLAHEPGLAQALREIVSNAVESIPDGHSGEHEVRLRTRRGEDDTVAVEIADTGQGIAPEHMDRLLEPFFTTREHRGGIGVGLALCHATVERLGGRIEVHSEPGRGATFRVVLPAAAPEERPVQPEPAEPRPSRVLVVDDEPLVADVLAGLLHGHEVTVAHSASAALDEVRNRDGFDVVFCDLMMPGMSGTELHERLNDEHPELAERMIFVTGGQFTERARSFLARVSNPTLSKPFSRSEVLRPLAERVPPG